MQESETQSGVYTVVLDANTWRDNDGLIVTCKVSNDDYVHDLNSSAKLVYMVHTQPLNFSLDKVQNSSPYFDSLTGETDLKGDYSTRSLKFSLEPILIGIGAFVVLCIFVASASKYYGVFYYLRILLRTDAGKAEVTSPVIDYSPSLDTNVYVDMSETSMHMNASHDLEDDHVEMKTRADSIARKPITPIEVFHSK
ncbi:uncharacterized protein LOC128234509 [Mya arenaria]|uniref:uncharacterized protein LOC128234509 n=1 Tax=Mya arenaria TaxID=6604 RepID=UPI0022E501A9|nr:uncharacterized protein LOC128234509 [Mya arenaria]